MEGTGGAERGRFHPAVFTLVVALLKGDLSLVGDPKRIAEAYRELGFEITAAAAWEHRRWLVAKGYVVVAATARGREVWLAERGLELARKLGLDGRLAPAAAPAARESQQLLGAAAGLKAGGGADDAPPRRGRREPLPFAQPLDPRAPARAGETR